MYFDLKPKAERKDLFGVEYSLTLLQRALADPSVRLIVIKGLRRLGKTSLLNVALQERKEPWVKIDVRDSPFEDRKEFLTFLFSQLRRALPEPLLKKILQGLAGVGVSYQELSFEVLFSKEEQVAEFFSRLHQQLWCEKKTLILALDEAQLLKKIHFDYLLASIFDNYGQIKVVLTGSEIGLLDKFLGRKDYHSPLYGRAALEIEVLRFKEEEIRRFLEEGFRQIPKKITFAEIKEVIENFDGIIGWATYYGWLRLQDTAHEKALEKAKQEGKELVRRELEQFLAGRKAKIKYRTLLHLLAKGVNTWGELKNSFLKERLPLADSQLQLYLKELLDYGFVEKKGDSYYLSDPILLKAVKG